MSNSIPVIRFLFRAEWKTLSAALGSQSESRAFAQAAELLSHLSGIPSALVITSIGSKEDLLQLATLQKLLKKAGIATVTKIVVVNYSKDRVIEKALAKLGILDVVDEKINTKALRFKIDFWMKSINVQLKQAAPMAVKNIERTQEAQKQNDKKATDQVSWAPPLDLADDVWILKHDSDCKKILSRWLLKIMGPGPYVAQWNEVNNRTNTWRLDFKEEGKDKFVTGNGNWYFEGDQKPDFVWKENIWLITGSEFHLFFKEGDKFHTRARLQNKIFTITKNSDAALFKEREIYESFDKEIVFKNEQGTPDEGESIENDQERYQNLEGQSKAESREAGYLSGKGKTSHLENAQMQRELSGNESLSNYWDGKNSRADNLDKNHRGPSGESFKEGDLLDLESEKRKHKSHYRGHNTSEDGSTDSNQYGPGGDKHREGQELGLEADHKNHKTHYRGHNPADLYDSKDPEKDRKAYREEAIDKNQYGPGDEKHRDGQELGLEDDHKNHKTHYRGHNPSEHYEGKESEKERKSYREEAIDKNQYGPAGEKHRNGSEQGLEAEHKNHKTHYRGHNPTEQYEGHEAEKAKKGYQENATDNNQYGPAGEKLKPGQQLGLEADNTPHKTHYRGLQKPGEISEEQSKDDPRRDKFGEGSLLDMDSGSKKHKTHYAGHGAAENQADQSNKRTNAAAEVYKSHYQNRPKGEAKNTKEDKDQGLSPDDVLAATLLDVIDPSIPPQNEETPESKVEHSVKSKPFFYDDQAKNPSFINPETAKIVNLLQTRKEREKGFLGMEPDDDLDKASQDARVTSFLVQDQRKRACILDDFFDQTVIFINNEAESLEMKSVSLDLHFNFQNSDTFLNIEGSVSQIDLDEEGKQYVTVELTQEDTSKFDTFMKLFQARQAHVSTFLKRAKGL